MSIMAPEGVLSQSMRQNGLQQKEELRTTTERAFERLAIEYAKRHQDHPVVIWDADDLLHPLMERVCRECGLDYNTATAVYHIRSNTKLTREQQDAILGAFANVRMFQNIQFFPGVERIAEAKRYGAEVKIQTHSFTQDIADCKCPQILAAVPDLSPSDIISTVIGEDEALRKDFGKKATIVSDDSPHNIATSEAPLNMMPTHIPWSYSQEAMRMVSGKYVVWRPTLVAMVEYANSFLEYLARR